jgi:hypothetical protein
MSRPGFLIPVLALAALFFGWRAYDAWTGPLGAVGPPPSNPPAVPIGVSKEEAPPPLDLSAPVVSIVARPVFRQDRKPFREETATIPKRNYEAELARFTLLGVLLLGKDRKGIVVGKGGTGKEERWEVNPGDSLPGFVVKEVGAEGVMLSADDREFLLPLYAGGPKVLPGQGPVRTEVAPPRPPAASAQPAPARPPGASPPPVPAGQAGTVRPPGNAASSPSIAVPPRTDPTDYRRGRTLRPTYIPGRR